MPDVSASSVSSFSAASGAGFTVRRREAGSACSFACDSAVISRATVRSADAASSNVSAFARGAAASVADLEVPAPAADSTASGLLSAGSSLADSVLADAPTVDPVSLVSTSSAATATSIGSGAASSREGDCARSRPAAEASNVGAVACGSICRSSRCTIRAPPLGNSVNKLKASSSSDSGAARSMRAFSLISARLSPQ